jgi:hypothetical protein
MNERNVEMAEERQEVPGDEPKNLGDTLNEFITHQRNAAKEACEALNALLPPDFRTHSRAAGEEAIKGVKVLVEGVTAVVDRELKRMRTSPESGSGGGPSTTGKSKVKVEVS